MAFTMRWIINEDWYHMFASKILEIMSLQLFSDADFYISINCVIFVVKNIAIRCSIILNYSVGYWISCCNGSYAFTIDHIKTKISFVMRTLYCNSYPVNEAAK